MTEQDLNLVPGKEHYAAAYVHGGRLFSYAHQMDAVLEHEPKAVLEVGPGPGMVTAALRAIDIQVTTMDIQPELKPDVVASVTDLPFEDDSFDVSMCCQVLEHLPFDQFVPALTELARVSRKAVVISLPDCSPFFNVRVRVPKLFFYEGQWYCPKHTPEARKVRKLERAGHYWEIGYSETRLGEVRKNIDSVLHISRTWRVPEFFKHRFFELTRWDGPTR